MPTAAERALLARRRAAESGDLLVPILERLLEYEVIPEDEEDFRFLDMLVRARALPRRKGVFSPSQLASCTRQVYLTKRGEKKVALPNTQANGYFLNGNFVHFKWQFAMWKAHRACLLELVKVSIAHELDILLGLRQDGTLSLDQYDAWAGALNFYGDCTRPGVEVRVVDEEFGDYGGTIDVLPLIVDNPYVIDFKGVRLDEFQRTVKKGANLEYRNQIVGYAKIASKVLGLDITHALLLSECKAGPVTGVGSPLGIHETLVPVADYEGEVLRRLRTLRYLDAKNILPAAECVSTRHEGFISCPFNERCREEVLVVQRERERKARARHTPITTFAKPDPR
jgi:hypothetical protein